MDSLRKFFGIPPPKQYSDGYYYWGQNVDEGSARDPNGFEIFEYSFPGSPNPNFPHGNGTTDFERELHEIERQFQEILSPFGGQRGFFSEFSPRFFGGEFNNQQVLPAPQPGPKVDEELDSKAINSETILAIMDEDKINRNRKVVPKASQPTSPFSHFPQLPPGMKSFSRSVSIQTTMRPDGVLETRKVVRDGEGNEQVTVTEHEPNSGAPSFPMQPGFGSDPFFGPHSKNNQRGNSIFDKIFGGF